jgi:hypothetical protein
LSDGKPKNQSILIYDTYRSVNDAKRPGLNRLRKNANNEGYGLYRLRKTSGPGRKDDFRG